MRESGLLRDAPGTTADTAGSIATGLFGMGLGAKAIPKKLLKKPTTEAKNVKINPSKSASIYNPKPLKQRPFHDDYNSWRAFGNVCLSSK